ncbi:MAG TPA: HD domain-containing protein, partial [Steroidobacteraceae bacterium]|nr:HD domain-containing protein [Steroidobacteraceae bacterium]
METLNHAPPEIATKLDAARAALLELGTTDAALEGSVEAAELVAGLTQDVELTVATALHWARRHGLTRDPLAAEARLSSSAMRLAASLDRLGELTLPADWSNSHRLDGQQAETLRKMLLAVADDPRLIVAR